MEFQLSRRRTFAAALLLLGCATVAVPISAKEKASRKPNVIFVLIDDMGWEDVSFMGSKYYRTPNIDALAARGVVFTNAYSAAPNCAPTRAALMSGKYGPRTGIYTVDFPNHGPEKARKLVQVQSKFILDPAFVTLAETFRANGYATGHFGKWHLGHGAISGPKAQGFDVNIGGSLRGAPSKGGYFSPYETKDWSEPGQDMPGLERVPPGEYLTDRLTDEVIGFASANRDRPFFAYLPHYTVHNPLEVPEGSDAAWQSVPADQRQGDPRYAAMVANLDANMGRLMTKLAEFGLTKNTIIVFTSDNGGHSGSTLMPNLRGDKGQFYEGGLRVPTFVVAPGGAKGKRVTTPTITVDWYPTLAELAGLKLPAGLDLDGRSMAGAVKSGKALPAKPIYWHMPIYLQSGAPFRGAKFDTPYIFRNRPRGAIRDGKWKLIENFEDGGVELYDLESDQRETTDLSKKLPAVANRLLSKLKAWQKQTGAPVPTEPNPAYDPNFRPAPKPAPAND